MQFKWSAIEDKWTWDDMSINYTSNKEQHLQWASQCANVVYQSSSSLWGFRTFFHSFHAAWNSRIFAPAPFRPPPQSQDPPRRALARGACPWRLRRDVLRSSLMTRGNWKQIQNCQIHIVSWCVCVCMLRAIYAHGCETHIAYSLVYHMYVYIYIFYIHFLSYSICFVSYKLDFFSSKHGIKNKSFLTSTYQSLLSSFWTRKHQTREPREHQIRAVPSKDAVSWGAGRDADPRIGRMIGHVHLAKISIGTKNDGLFVWIKCISFQKWGCCIYVKFQGG